MRCSRGDGQFLYPHPYWFERSEFMLLSAKTVGVRPVSRIDRLLESDREILIELALLRALLAYNVSRYIVGIIVREHWTVKGRPERHVVLRVGGRSQDAVHACAIIVAVGSPERGT